MYTVRSDEEPPLDASPLRNSPDEEMVDWGARGVWEGWLPEDAGNVPEDPEDKGMNVRIPVTGS